jgi:hypothetical protein
MRILELKLSRAHHVSSPENSFSSVVSKRTENAAPSLQATGYMDNSHSHPIPLDIQNFVFFCQGNDYFLVKNERIIPINQQTILLFEDLILTLSVRHEDVIKSPEIIANTIQPLLNEGEILSQKLIDFSVVDLNFSDTSMNLLPISQWQEDPLIFLFQKGQSP